MNRFITYNVLRLFLSLNSIDVSVLFSFGRVLHHNGVKVVSILNPAILFTDLSYNYNT